MIFFKSRFAKQNVPVATRGLGILLVLGVICACGFGAGGSQAAESTAVTFVRNVQNGVNVPDSEAAPIFTRQFVDGAQSRQIDSFSVTRVSLDIGDSYVAYTSVTYRNGDVECVAVRVTDGFVNSAYNTGVSDCS